MPLSFTIDHALTPNLTILTCITFTMVRLCVFGSFVSIEKTTMGLIKAELSLFKRITVLINLFSPFTLWAEHEQQFPNLIYFARQVMGIVGCQIEIERIFNMTGVITSLKHCQLGIENLDKLVLIMKNWLDDPKFDYTNGPKSFEKFLNFEDGMV